MSLFFNFFWAWAVMRWAKWRSYRIIALPAEQQDRLLTCWGCDFYRDGVCSACGCLTQAKVMLTTEKCPKNFWSRIWSRRVTTKL